jgi:AcrR family transcriptional regulator
MRAGSTAILGRAMAQVSDTSPVLLELPLADGEAPVRADAERNREKVLCAARRLFAERGVENVSMDAIAAEAGVGKGTLFRRFGDRAGLAAAVLDENTRQLQDDAIRGPAPLGPGAPPQERLKAVGAAQLGILDRHAELIAAAESYPKARFRSGPHMFLRLHIGVLVREADPDCDWELLTEFLVAPLTADTFVYSRRARGFELDRIVAAYEDLVDRVLP